MASAAAAQESAGFPKTKKESPFRIWRRLMAYLGKYRFWVAIAWTGIIGSNILAVAVPYILRDVVDVGIARQESAYMLSAGLLVVGLGLIRGVTAFFGPLLRRAALALRIIRHPQRDLRQGAAAVLHLS